MFLLMRRAEIVHFSSDEMPKEQKSSHILVKYLKSRKDLISRMVGGRTASVAAEVR